MCLTITQQASKVPGLPEFQPASCAYERLLVQRSSEHLPVYRLLPVLQQVHQREEGEHRGREHGAGRLRALQLLPFVQGTQ